MDLIYTNAKKIDQGVLNAYALDLSYGESENDFEITLGTSPRLENGAYIYIEGTEYGGIVDGLKAATDSETVTYMGRTWHGILNSKIIQPDANAAYFVVSGDANEVISILIDRLGLYGSFRAEETLSGINISNYQFARYCKGYDGLKDMLSSVGAKLKVEWKNRSAFLSAVPIVDYTKDGVDGDTAVLSVELHQTKVNHLICLGKGELADREVIHLYVDQFRRIGDVQCYGGILEVAETYENANSEDLRADGIKQLEELRNTDIAEISIGEDNDRTFDIGDIVGATELTTNISVATAVTQKIIKINNGTVSVEYKTGG